MLLLLLPPAGVCAATAVAVGPPRLEERAKRDAMVFIGLFFWIGYDANTSLCSRSAVVLLLCVASTSSNYR